MKDLGNNSFEVQRYGEEGSATRKYKNTELYLLPLAVFPSETLATMDQRYLDCNNSPIVSPLLKPMKIELYNNKWFQTQENALNTQSWHTHLPSSELDSIVFQPHAGNNIPSIEELDGEPTPTPEICQSFDPVILPSTPCSFHSKVLNSTNKLFFIEYTPAGTMLHK